MTRTRMELAAVAVLATVLCFGCSAEPATVEISPPDNVINFADQVPKLTARVLDAEGNVIEGAKVLWSTPDEGVLTVDPDTGAITVKGSGRAEVDAESRTARGLAMVTVALYTTLSLDSHSLQLKIGELEKVESNILNEKGEPIRGVVEWASADPKIATANHRGEVRGVAPGVTAVTATAKALKSEVMIEVMQPGPFDLQVSKAFVELKVGKTAKVEGKPVDENGKDDTKYPVSYDTDDSAIATVAEDGTITGVAPGETQIEVMAGDKNVFVKVLVK